MAYDPREHAHPGGMGAQALILVVEDDAANLQLTQAVLEQAGHRVLTADSAEQARGVLSRERPDLVLTDIALPGDSGLILAREVTHDPGLRGVPVVALTAHALPEMRRRVLEVGCVDCLVKPIDIYELVRRVEARLRR